MENVLFYFFAGIALVAAVFVVAMRRVFYSALSLIVCLTAISAIYMLLEAPFIAAVQVIVYAGAIMVLFLFVIMLLDPFSSAVLKDKSRYLKVIGVLLGAAGLVMVYPLLSAYKPAAARGTADTGSIAHIGVTLFSDYLLPFEATSVLILVAIIGAVVLARKES
jgi:NADH-quinone oxidoreductase subunit J